MAVVINSKTWHPSHERYLSLAMSGVFQLAHNSWHVAQNQCCWNSSSISNLLKERASDCPTIQTVWWIRQIRRIRRTWRIQRILRIQWGGRQEAVLCATWTKGECASSKRRQITVTHFAWKLMLIIVLENIKREDGFYLIWHNGCFQ